MVSVIILVKNEERDLPGCLASLDWCDDVHVVDSGSTDRTIEIARSAGGNVLSNPFKSFGDQRNWALDHCELKHGWVLFLDADEQSTPAFHRCLIEACSRAPEETAGFYCCWRMMLNETWLKRSDNFPKWQFRLLRQGRARFTDFGHGQKEGEVSGRLDYLHEPYLHFAFSRGWAFWEEKHKKYASQEAVARSKHQLHWPDVFSSHSSKRNPAIKLLIGRNPAWPTFRFVYSYILKGGFLEGKEGYTYCRRMAWYERQIQRMMRR